MSASAMQGGHNKIKPNENLLSNCKTYASAKRNITETDTVLSKTFYTYTDPYTYTVSQ